MDPPSQTSLCTTKQKRTRDVPFRKGVPQHVADGLHTNASDQYTPPTPPSLCLDDKLQTRASDLPLFELCSAGNIPTDLDVDIAGKICLLFVTRIAPIDAVLELCCIGFLLHPAVGT